MQEINEAVLTVFWGIVYFIAWCLGTYLTISLVVGIANLFGWWQGFSLYMVWRELRRWILIKRAHFIRHQRNRHRAKH